MKNLQDELSILVNFAMLIGQKSASEIMEKFHLCCQQTYETNTSNKKIWPDNITIEELDATGKSGNDVTTNLSNDIYKSGHILKDLFKSVIFIFPGGDHTPKDLFK